MNKNTHIIYALSLFVLLSLSACNVSIRNPSTVTDAPLLDALPDKVLGKTILLEYTSAAAGDPSVTVYDSGEKLAFSFDVDGALYIVGANEADDVLIDESFDLERQRFIWIDEDNELEYVLTINDGGIGTLVVQTAEGERLGQFNLVSVNPDVNTDGDANNNQNQGQDDIDSTETVLPDEATGEHQMIFVETPNIGGVNAPFDDGAEVTFNFFSRGQLQLNGKDLSASYVEREGVFVWKGVIDFIEFEFQLSLDENDEVDEVTLVGSNSGGGGSLGVFEFVSKGGNY